MDSTEKTFRKEELNNNLLKEIYKRNFPNYKIYNRDVYGADIIVVQKNGSVAVSARVSEKENSKLVKFDWTDTDSFFHMKILPWILILFAVFPAIIWFFVHVVSRSNLHEECLNVTKEYFDDATIVAERNLEIK